MLASGVNIEHVSQELGLSPATAQRYQTLFASGGVAPLMRLGDVGRRSRLSTEAIGKIIRTVRSEPRLNGSAADSWTHERVQQFIEQEFGIRYSASHFNRLIRDLGLRQHVRRRRFIEGQSSVPNLWLIPTLSSPYGFQSL